MSDETRGIRFEKDGVMVEVSKYVYHNQSNEQKIGIGLEIVKSYSDMKGKSKKQFLSQMIQDLKGVVNEFEQLLEKEDNSKDEIKQEK